MSLLGGALPPVVATLMADIGQYSVKMDEAAAKMQIVDKAGKDASNKVVKNFAEAGLGVVAASLYMSTEFQTQMTRLYTAAGAPRDAVKAATGQVLDLADAVGYSGTQMAEALYHPVSAGLNLATSLNAVKYSAIEAQISGAALDDTTYSLSSVMKAFNQDASQAHDTMALLNSIVGQGDMRFQDFNVSVKNWAPTSAQMGISIQSMGSALAYLTDRGNSAEEASTRVTMGLTMMAYPSQKAATMLEGLGVASSDVAASNEYMTSVLKKTGITQNQLAEDLKQPDGIYVALTHLKTALHDAGVEGTEADSVMSKIFGGGRSDKAILSLMQNLDGLKTKYDDIGHGVKNFDQAWKDTQDTLGFKFKQLAANLENIGIRIGNVLIPAVSAVVGWFDRNKIAVEGLAVAVGVVLAAATLRYVQLVTTKLLTALDTLATRYSAAGRAAREAAAAQAEANGASAGWATKLGSAVPYIGLAVTGLSMLNSWLNTSSDSTKVASASADEYVVALMKVGDTTAQLSSLSGLQGTASDMQAINQALANNLDLQGKFEGRTIGSSGIADAFYKLRDSTATTVEPVAQLGAALGRVNQLHSDQAVTGLHNFDDALAKLATSGHADRAAQIFDEIGSIVDKNGNKLINTTRDFPDYIAAINGAAAAQSLGVGAADANSTALDQQAKAALDAAGANNDLADSLTAADQAWDQLSNNISASGALHTFQKDLLSVNDTIDQNGKSFNDSSLKGLANMEAFRQAADEIAKYRDAQKKAGVDVDIYNQTAAQQIKQLEKVWENLGVNKKAVEDYANSLGLIPANLTTTLTVHEQGLVDLAAKLDAVNRKRQQLGQPLIIPGTKMQQALAGGGLVSGPGGPTSDSVPIRASNGEYMMKASAVQRFGVGFMDAINAGRIPNFASSSGSTGPARFAGPAGGGGGVTVINEIYLDGQKLSGAMRRQTLKYDYRNSGNNLALSSAGAGGGFR